VSRCIREREVFSLLDGSLKLSAKRRVEEHLAACSDCAHRVETLSQLKAATLEALPPLEPNWAKINPAIEHAISEVTSRRNPRLAWAPLGFSVAAAALVAIALFVSSTVEKPDIMAPATLELTEAARPELVYEPLELLALRVVDTSSPSSDLEIGQRLEAGDTVTTGAMMAARIAMGPSATFDVSPESRLELHSDTVLRPTVELSAGTSLFDIPAGALERELTVLAGGTLFTVLDGIFELSITDKGVIVAVLQGEITVADADEPTVLATGDWQTGGPEAGDGDGWMRLERTPVEKTDGGIGSGDLTEREWHRPTGTLPRRIVRETFDRARPNLKACYETALKRFPKLEVSVTARVSVGTRGQVAKVRLRGGERWPDLERCISTVLNQLSFPPPNGGPVDLIFPLRLSPER